MKIWMRGLATLTALVAIVAAAPAVAKAQHVHGAGGGDASMCAEVQPSVTQIVDTAMMRLETARQSNSASAMRAAVEELQVALVTLKTQLAPCAALQPAPPVVEKPAPAAASAASPLDITFRTEGDPKPGDGVFEVTVKDTAGKPVTDATVSVVLFMPAMPRMPAMRHEAKLGHTADGVYRGPGQIMMAGAWEVTVTVTRGGKPVSKQFGLTAK
jgi:hypothetical protein